MQLHALAKERHKTKRLIQSSSRSEAPALVVTTFVGPPMGYGQHH